MEKIKSFLSSNCEQISHDRLLSISLFAEILCVILKRLQMQGFRPLAPSATGYIKFLV